MVSGSSRWPGLYRSSRVPSWWKIAGPSASTKTAGAYLATVTVALLEAAWLAMERTTSGYLPAASVGGNWALIWPGELASSGRGELLSVTQVPPRTDGSGVLAAEAAEASRCPKMETNPPEATLGM